MRLFSDADYDLVGSRKAAYIFSAVLILISLIAIVSKGLQYGIDFTGGKEYVVEFEENVEVADVRDALTDVLEKAPQVIYFGNPTEVAIRTGEEGGVREVEESIISSLQQLYPENDLDVIKTSNVGASFAEDLQGAATNAVIFALVIIFIYVLIRFKKWTYSTGAVLGLAHDVIIVLGIFTIFAGIAPFNMDIDQALIAAFLTIVGYSINDTVVVFDRVRENLHKHKGKVFEQVMNRGMNQTLSRTIIISLTTFFTVTVLFLFGGETLKGFSLALMLGIIFGTYSSIFVATSITIDLENYRRNKAKAAN